MHKSLFLKMVFLMILLVAVLAVIVVTLSADFNEVTRKASQTHNFFSQFVIAGGPIVWFILLPMSLISVYLAVEHSLVISRKKLLPEGVSKKIVAIMQESGLGQLPARIAHENDFVSTAAAKAIAQGKGDWFRIRNLLAESLQEQALALMRRIEWINLIGNVAPMVGLFGTVVGMIQLFDAIVVAGGQPQPAQLAGGISVALVTTFWGLLIAIPALSVHGVFRNKIETLANDAVLEVDNIMPEIKRSLEKQSRVEQTKEKQPIREIPGKPTPARRESSLPL